MLGEHGADVAVFLMMMHYSCQYTSMIHAKMRINILAVILVEEFYIKEQVSVLLCNNHVHNINQNPWKT